MENNSLESVAYHEASHAVCSFILHLPFIRISILPQDDSDGRVSYPEDLPQKLLAVEFDLNKRNIHRAEAHIITSYAGVIGEAKFLGAEPHDISYSDQDLIIDLALCLGSGPEDTKRIIDESKARATELLNIPENWAAVEALSAALLFRKQISGRTARKIIKEAIQEAQAIGR